MKIYTHDYTLPSLADELLWEAQVKIHLEDWEEVKTRIEEARRKLLKYLAQDNMREDGDARGWVKYSDVENIMDPEKYI